MYPRSVLPDLTFHPCLAKLGTRSCGTLAASATEGYPLRGSRASLLTSAELNSFQCYFLQGPFHGRFESARCLAGPVPVKSLETTHLPRLHYAFNSSINFTFPFSFSPHRLSLPPPPNLPLAYSYFGHILHYGT